jgi:Tfp pilus assembly protein FimV
MIPFLNPWVILGLISALAGVFGYGHHVGWNSRDDQARIETAAANDAARILEQQLRTQLDDQTAQLRKANSEIARKTTALSAANAAGQLRLPAPTCPSVQASSNASAPAGVSREGPSELERQTIEALIAIAADGDRAAAKANACIDAYNKVRDQLNGQR